MAVCSVIALVEPLIANRWRCLQRLGNFRLRHSLVHHPDGLVMHVTVVVPLTGQPPFDFRLPEPGPTMAGCNGIAAIAVKVGRFVQETGPGVRVAHLCAAGRQNIVECAGRDFGGKESSRSWNINVHFRWRF